MPETRKPGHLGDGWLQVDSSDDPSFFVRFLDASRTRALDFARERADAAFAHLALKPGVSVLDCGCGTGDMLALMSKLIAPGQACGGDLSDAMLHEARRRPMKRERSISISSRWTYSPCPFRTTLLIEFWPRNSSYMFQSRDARCMRCVVSQLMGIASQSRTWTGTPL